MKMTWIGGLVTSNVPAAVARACDSAPRLTVVAAATLPLLVAS